MLKLHDTPAVDYQLARKVYYIILFTITVWMFLIFTAPLLMDMGGTLKKISSVIYLFFSTVCHQDDTRSFHLSEHKLGVCSRCVWIYGGFLAGALFYPIRFKLNSLSTPNIFFLIIPSLLIVLDVGLETLDFASNTFFSRSLTGFLMGFILPFFIVPGFVKFFYEIHSYLRNKISM